MAGHKMVLSQLESELSEGGRRHGRGWRRWARRRRFGTFVASVLASALLLPLLLLHATILEPNLHLGLVELELSRDLKASRAREVLGRVEFLLQLRELFRGEVGAISPGGVVEDGGHAKRRSIHD